MIISVILFVVFFDAVTRLLQLSFSADWSDDLRRLTMSQAKKQMEQTDLFHNFKLYTPRKEIAILVDAGYSIKQIAVDIGISFDTAKYHIKNLYKKLDISSLV